MKCDKCGNYLQPTREVDQNGECVGHYACECIYKKEPIFDIDDETIRALFFLEMGDKNMLAMFFEKKDHYLFRYRNRYYRDEKIFDSEDIKKVTNATIPKLKSLSEAINEIKEEFFNKLKNEFGGKYYEVIRGEMSLENFKEEMFKQVFLHVSFQGLAND